MTEPRRTRLPQVLFEIGKAIGSGDDLNLMLGRISELLCELLGADATSVMLVDGDGQHLLGKAAHGMPAENVLLLSFRVGEGVAGWVVKHLEPALIDDVAADPRFVYLHGSETKIVSMVCVPLMAGGVAVGALTATAPRREAFSQEDVELLSFLAMTIALDVENIRLRRVSVTDPLTGAYNREFLARRLPDEIATAAQRGAALSVAMVDVDHFKPINDRFGHEIGDEVLAEVARRLRAAIRADDLLVRYGGEEFLIVLPNTDAEIARNIAERMRLELHGEAIRAGDHALEVRISVGVAQLANGDGAAREGATALIRRADTALYSAKDHGRNRVEVAE
jgi:diguanylate cyclase (GGDEF)-like protein